MGLAHAADRRVKGYSMGMRQRLGITAALLGQPEVLILDEPANGLDPPGIRWLRELMREQAGEGRAVLVSSHLLAEVAQSADEVVVIAEGSLRAQGPLREVLGAGAGAVTVVRTPDAERLAQALARSGLHTEPGGPDELVVHGAAPEAVGRAAGEEGVVVIGLAERGRSFEDAFLDLTGQAR